MEGEKDKISLKTHVQYVSKDWPLSIHLQKEWATTFMNMWSE